MYRREFNVTEVIWLDKDAISPNPVKRGQAKLCLNSMKGKLTERNNRTKTKVNTHTQELYNLLPTPGTEVANVPLASETVVSAS